MGQDKVDLLAKVVGLDSHLSLSSPTSVCPEATHCYPPEKRLVNDRSHHPIVRH